MTDPLDEIIEVGDFLGTVREWRAVGPNQKDTYIDQDIAWLEIWNKEFNNK